MSPTGDLLVTLIFLGEVSSWACSEAFTCCARPAHSWRQHTLWGKSTKCDCEASKFWSSCCDDKHILRSLFNSFLTILAEGAIALSVTLSGGALFGSWKLLQFPSSLIVKVILAIFRRASAQQPQHAACSFKAMVVPNKFDNNHVLLIPGNVSSRQQQIIASQRSLHNAPIFRLLLKVAVKGTHQCDLHNFGGTFGFQQIEWKTLSQGRRCWVHYSCVDNNTHHKTNSAETIGLLCSIRPMCQNGYGILHPFT